MSMSDAFVIVACDKCRINTLRIELCAIACNGYDTRNVNEEVEQSGWKVDGDEHICEGCLGEENEKD